LDYYINVDCMYSKSCREYFVWLGHVSCGVIDGNVDEYWGKIKKMVNFQGAVPLDFTKWTRASSLVASVSLSILYTMV
jgi:hypothetical protein